MFGLKPAFSCATPHFLYSKSPSQSRAAINNCTIYLSCILNGRAGVFLGCSVSRGVPGGSTQRTWGWPSVTLFDCLLFSAWFSWSLTPGYHIIPLSRTIKLEYKIQDKIPNLCIPLLHRIGARSAMNASIASSSTSTTVVLIFFNNSSIYQISYLYCCCSSVMVYAHLSCYKSM